MAFDDCKTQIKAYDENHQKPKKRLKMKIIRNPSKG
jgi:hypothetical protein